MAWYPVPEILAIVQDAPDSATGWARLRALRDRHWPSPLWSELPEVDPASDATAAANWLRAQLRAARAARVAVHGLYLGLDTLNMDGPNVEIGATGDVRPGQL